MIKKLVSLIVCLPILVLSFTACSNETSAYTDKDDGTPLMIYLTEHMEFMKYHINAYNAICDETEIDYEIIDGTSPSRELYKKIKDELHNGKGPDLIYIDKTTLSEITPQKMHEHFADMDKLIDKSMYFDNDHYNMKVLDSAIYDEKRLFIPISFNIDMVYTAKEHFDNYGIEAPAELTMDVLLDILDKYDAKETKQIPALKRIRLSDSVFRNLEKDDYLEKTQWLESILEHENKDFNKINKSTFIKDFKIAVQEGNVREALFKWNLDNNILFVRPSFYDRGVFEQLYYKYNIAKMEYNRELIVYKYPTVADDDVSYFNRGIAININSQKKNRAFKFIEYMLSEDAQSDENRPPTIPVNLEVYNKEVKAFTNGDYDMFQDT